MVGPIGMFDSGFGGLTVARAVIDLLPSEDLVYLGDTARYPYGARSLTEVAGFSLEIARFLVEKFSAKCLIVACNTATAAALEMLRDSIDVPVIGVIDPGVQSLLAATSSKRIGVIGTVATIGSGAYERQLFAADPEAFLIGCACPGFVEFVERGVFQGAEISLLAERLLTPVVAANIDALLLGCTHYPYLARVISDVVGPDVVLVSSADECAFAAARVIGELGLAHPDSGREGTHHFVSSGDVQSFAEIGGRLLGPELVDAELWTGSG